MEKYQEFKSRMEGHLSEETIEEMYKEIAMNVMHKQFTAFLFSLDKNPLSTEELYDWSVKLEEILKVK